MSEFFLLLKSSILKNFFLSTLYYSKKKEFDLCFIYVGGSALVEKQSYYLETLSIKPYYSKLF